MIWTLLVLYLLYLLYCHLVLVKSVKMSSHRRSDISEGVSVRCKVAGVKGTNKNIINKRLTLDRISFESFHFLKKYHWIRKIYDLVTTQLLKIHPPKFCVILYFFCDIIHPTHRMALEYKMVKLLELYCHHLGFAPGSQETHSFCLSLPSALRLTLTWDLLLTGRAPGTIKSI